MLVFNKPITPLLIELHLLPVKARIDYKLAVLTFKCLNNLAPIYLVKLIDKYYPTRTLRSSINSNLLSDKKYEECNYKSPGEQYFVISTPKPWNSLPVELRMAKSLQHFKIIMKSYLYRQFYT